MSTFRNKAEDNGFLPSENGTEEKFAEPPVEKKTKCQSIVQHIIGILLLPPLLIFHFFCFLVTMSMAIGVGLVGASLHQIFWDQKLPIFWQTYITLFMVAIVVEIFFRLTFHMQWHKCWRRVQQKHLVELYCIPRFVYICGYVAAVVMLYFAYQGAHCQVPPTGVNSTNSTRPSLVSIDSESTFDGEGNVVEAWKTNPLSLSRTDDQFHYSLIFFISLNYMTYTLSKENDWVTHRLIVLDQGFRDPASRGGLGNFALFLCVHIVITFVYGLPLGGCVYLARQFLLGPELTFTLGVFISFLVGIAALFIERRSPFPSRPLISPTFSYENHLRIRLVIFQFWLLPFAAGRYFDENRAKSLSAQNDDLLAFTIEVGIGIVQAIKIFGNDLFLLRELFHPKFNRNEEPLEEHYLMTSNGSLVTINNSTQTLLYNDSDFGFHDPPKPITQQTPEKREANTDPLSPVTKSVKNNTNVPTAPGQKVPIETLNPLPKIPQTKSQNSVTNELSEKPSKIYPKSGRSDDFHDADSIVMPILKENSSSHVSYSSSKGNVVATEGPELDLYN